MYWLSPSHRWEQTWTPESVKALNKPLPQTHNALLSTRRGQNQSRDSLRLRRSLDINKVQLMPHRSISPENQYFVLSLYLLHPCLSPVWDHSGRTCTTVLNAARLPVVKRGNRTAESRRVLVFGIQVLVRNSWTFRFTSDYFFNVFFYCLILVFQLGY